MNKPQPIEYETPYKTVKLTDPTQLVVKNGIDVINAGTVKHNGKYVPFFLRYDNKPELLSKTNAWVESWHKYNAWLDKQVLAAKSTMTTNSLVNFDQAENQDFSWSYWDGTSGKTLTHKSSARQIYQMKYTDSGESVQGETRVRASAFWSALWELQDDPKPALTQEEENATTKMIGQLPINNNHPGWCNHCHSYCYGDCRS